jgi:hypothetical protein
LISHSTPTERLSLCITCGVVFRRVAPAPAVLLVVAGLTSCSDGAEDESAESRRLATRTVSPDERADLIARAQVWRAPEKSIAQASLAPEIANEMQCRFTLGDLGGTTPKFHCRLESGEEVRAKYGPGGEIPAEAAATRLLSVLGFGADRVTLVKRLRCYGCPKEPFVTSKIVESTGTGKLYAKTIDHGEFEEFEWIALEHRFPAPAIETDDWKGWAFFELNAVDPSKGGAPREHVDALRLLAVFLAHWDNKPDNQRLFCLVKSWPEGTPCSAPFLMLQDVGATFGPRKVNLEAWESAQLWGDRLTCTLSMRDMPHGGGTFQSVRVLEGGRQFLAGLLGALTDAQLVDLFSGAGFDQSRPPLMQNAPVSEWVRVFRQRVTAISEGPSCPAA